ncbi:MAG: tRNA threonylcarbamoyladenosine dehydratase [Lachnospiraceae bacterium]|nr:tRNA threonylcarbamoyladenosine dehydratase [Lachnospiraceae bacterium]
MKKEFSRTEIMLGNEAMKKLQSARVIVFGIGGVGGYTVEALARSGVGVIDIVDNDTVDITNINRQIIATQSTVGRYKVDVMRERILDINPECKVNTHRCFYLPETKGEFDFSEYDYIIDAVDTITAKIDLVMEAKANNVQIISCMGAGNKMDPTAFLVSDIYKTSVCPLAKVMRRELKKRGVNELKVVYSKEETKKPQGEYELPEGKRQIPGSNAFVPSVAGLVMAAEVIKDLTSS